jgi:hypothetical protein
MYAPSWFAVPTPSSQYLQAAQANMGPFRRGAGTIFSPGPGGARTPLGYLGQNGGAGAPASSGPDLGTLLLIGVGVYFLIGGGLFESAETHSRERPMGKMTAAQRRAYGRKIAKMTPAQLKRYADEHGYDFHEEWR